MWKQKGGGGDLPAKNTVATTRKWTNRGGGGVGMRPHFIKNGYKKEHCGGYSRWERKEEEVAMLNERKR